MSDSPTTCPKQTPLEALIEMRLMRPVRHSSGSVMMIPEEQWARLLLRLEKSFSDQNLVTRVIASVAGDALPWHQDGPLWKEKAEALEQQLSTALAAKEEAERGFLRTVQVTSELFPNSPIQVSESYDPEYPDDKWLVLKVWCQGDNAKILALEGEWCKRIKTTGTVLAIARAESAEAQLAAVKAERDKLKSILMADLVEWKKADEERLRQTDAAHAEAQKWKDEDDMYGWNFHEGKAGGTVQASLCYDRVRRHLEAALARWQELTEGGG